MNNRVYVTAMGSCSAAGDTQAFWDSTLAQKCCLSEYASEKESPAKVVGSVSLKLNSIFPGRYQSFISRHAQLGAFAMKECLRNSGLPLEMLIDSGLLFGSASQGMDKAYDVIKALDEKPFNRVNYNLLNSISDSSVCHLLAAHFGIGGYVHSLSAASCTGMIALLNGFNALKSGVSKRIFVASGEANLFPSTLLFYTRKVFLQGASYYIFGKVEDPQERDLENYVIPFSPPYISDRGAIAEAGAALLLETEEAVMERGVEPLGEIKEGSFSFYADSHHGHDPQQIGLRRVFEKLKIKDVDSLYLPVSGSHVIDAALVSCCSRYFPKRHVFTAEPLIGHTGGATSLLNIILAVKSLQEGIKLPTKNFRDREFDDQFKLVPSSISIKAKDFSSVLVASSGWGGYNGACVVGK
ncbi:MAG: beta-ketoacyl synthase N-terminal-like domain-containing protein [Spirochaetaceae bacterium]|jgi:3-oxoacyl-(acyl-carrier-protein) synthase|nr:beta-ketoacyl synthase N-terminal-like domain-containing protein [Spirochaetaceae bacterium]